MADADVLHVQRHHVQRPVSWFEIIKRAWALFRALLAKLGQAKAEADQQAIDIADEVQNDVGAIPPDKRREELRKW